MMQVFVKCVDGNTVTVDVTESSSVLEIKEKLFNIQDIPIDEYSLTYGLSCLEDDDYLCVSGITTESTLFQSFRLLGGGKKRKRKQYTKPKKGKHKKKKVKLAVLKFYKVDQIDKVTRLRKECPAETCGTGVFMADHQNRTYCGRCGLTYIRNKGEEEE